MTKELVKTPGSKKTPYRVIFPREILMYIGREIPLLIPENKRIQTSTFTKSIHFMKETGLHLEARDDVSSEMNDIGNIKKLFSVGFEIDTKFTLDFCRNFNILLETPVEEILENEFLLKFLSELYDTNFYMFKHKGEMPLEFLKILIKYCLYFENYAELQYPKNLIEKTEGYEILINKIQSKKVQINEIFLNLSCLLNFSHFYNNWLVCFRGRKYPAGTFTYQMPLVRNFISFAYKKEYDFKY